MNMLLQELENFKKNQTYFLVDYKDDDEVENNYLSIRCKMV